MGIDVVHLADEEDLRREREPAEEVERLADVRMRPAPLAEDVAGAVGGDDERKEEDDARRSRHPVPVRGDEQHDAQPRHDGTDGRDDADDPPAGRGRRLARVAAADRRGLLRGDEPLGRPGVQLVLELAQPHRPDHSVFAIEGNPVVRSPRGCARAPARAGGAHRLPLRAACPAPRATRDAGPRAAAPELRARPRPVPRVRVAAARAARRGAPVLGPHAPARRPRRPRGARDRPRAHRADAAAACSRSRSCGRLRVLAHPLVALPLWAANLYLWHLPVALRGRDPPRRAPRARARVLPRLRDADVGRGRRGRPRARLVRHRLEARVRGRRAPARDGARQRLLLVGRARLRTPTRDPSGSGGSARSPTRATRAGS